MNRWRGLSLHIVVSIAACAGCDGASTTTIAGTGASTSDSAETVVATAAPDALLDDELIVESDPADDGERAPSSFDCRDCEGRHRGSRHAIRGVLPGSAGQVCFYGTSDKQGDVALGFGDSRATWDVYARDGAPLASIASSDEDWLQGDAYPLKSGFQIPFLRVSVPVHGELFIGTWTRHGAKLGEQAYANLGPFSVDSTRSPMPAGGVFTTSLTMLPGLNGTTTTLKWIGPASELLGSRSFDVRSTFVGSTGGAVDRRGHTLAWFPGTTGLEARWFDIGGRPRGPTFRAPFPGDAVLASLIGGGFAVRVGDDWVGTIDSDGRMLEPAPHWLASRPRSTLVILEFGLAYALLLDDGETAPPEPQRIELRAPWGARLGTVLVVAPRGDVRVQRTRIGRDDTVVQLLTESVGATTDCAYRFWPHALP